MLGDELSDLLDGGRWCNWVFSEGTAADDEPDEDAEALRDLTTQTPSPSTLLNNSIQYLLRFQWILDRFY